MDRVEFVGCLEHLDQANEVVWYVPFLLLSSSSLWLEVVATACCVMVVVVHAVRMLVVVVVAIGEAEETVGPLDANGHKGSGLHCYCYSGCCCCCHLHHRSVAKRQVVRSTDPDDSVVDGHDGANLACISGHPIHP